MQVVKYGYSEAVENSMVADRVTRASVSRSVTQNFLPMPISLASVLVMVIPLAGLCEPNLLSTIVR